MDGIFCRQKFLKFQNILGLISGLVLILLFGFFICIGEFDTPDDRIASWFFGGFGVFAVLLCSVSLHINRKVYLHVDEETISAFCHFGLELHCRLTDVANVSYGGMGLNLQLKNGRKYNLMYLENAVEIGSFIQRRTAVKPATLPDPKDLFTMIPPLKKARNAKGIGSIVCFLLLFPEIILTAALTDWKDLSEFHSGDWTLFAVMAGVGIATLALFGILLRKYLLDADRLTKVRGELYRTVLLSAPLQPGNALKMYVDDDLFPSIRLTVYGYPNSEEVYFTVEQVNRDYRIQCLHTSKVYANIQELMPEIEGMPELPLP